MLTAHESSAFEYNATLLLNNVLYGDEVILNSITTIKAFYTLVCLCVSSSVREWQARYKRRWKFRKMSADDFFFSTRLKVYETLTSPLWVISKSLLACCRNMSRSLVLIVTKLIYLYELFGAIVLHASLMIPAVVSSLLWSEKWNSFYVFG